MDSSAVVAPVVAPSSSSVKDEIIALKTQLETAINGVITQLEANQENTAEISPILTELKDTLTQQLDAINVIQTRVNSAHTITDSSPAPTMGGRRRKTKKSGRKTRKTRHRRR